ncbi:MAG: hypothetical protein ACKO96_23105, partial [Flammeovirgaceae bacterium]
GSHIQDIYDNAFRETLILAHKLITDENVDFSTVMKTFNKFYIYDQVGRHCAQARSTSSILTFAAQIIRAKQTQKN